MNELGQALSLRRASGSVTESEYCAGLLSRLLAYGKLEFIDEAGNFALVVGNGSKTLFTAHTDTVHSSGGVNKVVNSVGSHKEVWKVKPRGSSKDKWGSCLGADDGAGVAILAHLMSSGVSGTYLFCRGEEVGGVGSSYLAQNRGDWLRKFDRAIAFDRRGFSDVITAQAGGECASLEFALELAVQLSSGMADGSVFAPCDKGVFTDTANFVEHIRECTNISVGYEFAHSENETLDVDFLRCLADSVVSVDWESLPTMRKIARKFNRKNIDWNLVALNPEVHNSYYGSEFWAALNRAYEGDCSLLITLLEDYMGYSLSISQVDAEHLAVVRSANDASELDILSYLVGCYETC